jgi:hypothetical protein
VKNNYAWNLVHRKTIDRIEKRPSEEGIEFSIKEKKILEVGESILANTHALARNVFASEG